MELLTDTTIEQADHRSNLTELVEEEHRLLLPTATSVGDVDLSNANETLYVILLED